MTIGQPDPLQPQQQQLQNSRLPQGGGLLPAPAPQVQQLSGARGQQQPGLIGVGQPGQAQQAPQPGQPPAPHAPPPGGVATQAPPPGAPPAPHTPGAPAPGAGVAGVDPAGSFSPQAALDMVQRFAGGPLSQAQIQEAIQIAGYSGSGNLTGAQLNRVLQEVANRTGQQFNTFGAAPGAPGAPGSAGLIQQGQGALSQLLTQLQQPVSIQDPILQRASDAFRQQTQRGAERQRNALAERRAASGLGVGGGAFDAGIQGIEAESARQSAAHDSGLVLDEMKDRRNMLLDAIKQAEASGQFGMAHELQKLLGMRDLDLREKGIDLQGTLGKGDLLLRLLGLKQGNQQFYDQLGTNHGQWLADFNQRSLRDILGAF